MKKSTHFLLLMSFILFVTYSCKKKDDTPADACSTAGTFTCKIDGVLFTGKTYTNTLLVGTSGGVDTKRLDIRATDASGKQIIVSVTEQRDGLVGDGFPTTYNDYNLDVSLNYCNSSGTGCNAALLTIGSVISSPVSDSGPVRVTACDITNKKISGTFSGTITPFGSSSPMHTVTEGVFTNVCYTVIR